MKAEVLLSFYDPFRVHKLSSLCESHTLLGCEETKEALRDWHFAQVIVLIRAYHSALM